MNTLARRTPHPAWRIKQNDRHAPQRNVLEPPIPSGVTVATSSAAMATNWIESPVGDDPDNNFFSQLFNALDTKALQFERAGDQLGNEHGFLSEIVW
jgi:hypothetical protein